MVAKFCQKRRRICVISNLSCRAEPLFNPELRFHSVRQYRDPFAEFAPRSSVRYQIKMEKMEPKRNISGIHARGKKELGELLCLRSHIFLLPSLPLHAHTSSCGFFFFFFFFIFEKKNFPTHRSGCRLRESNHRPLHQPISSCHLQTEGTQITPCGTMSMPTSSPMAPGMATEHRLVLLNSAA